MIRRIDTDELPPIKISHEAITYGGRLAREAGWSIVEALGDSPESNALAAFLNVASDATLAKYRRLLR